MAKINARDHQSCQVVFGLTKAVDVLLLLADAASAALRAAAQNDYHRDIMMATFWSVLSLTLRLCRHNEHFIIQSLPKPTFKSLKLTIKSKEEKVQDPPELSPSRGILSNATLLSTPQQIYL
jgi:hypothetical protein